MQRVVAPFLILASILFWLSWLLMPGVGITDAARILALVSQHRPDVFLSVVLQLVSAALYAPGLVALVQTRGQRRQMQLGAILILIGAMGSAADAIFHLVAFEMTAPDMIVETILPMMRRLQGPDLALLLPFVLAFFAGHLLVAWGARKEGPLAKAGAIAILVFPLMALAGGPLTKLGIVPARIVGLSILAALNVSLSLVALAIGLSRSPQRDGI